ncbi:hypothetical protein MRX96_045479 [Rhipicephalus microplus]
MQRVDTTMREAISVEKRVAVSLYRLCSAAEDRTIAELFAIGRSTVNLIYKEFFTGFPQGVGALDGCHFTVSPPKKYASDYYNYKGWYSMILLALVDHRYRFRYTNVGSPG